MPDSETIFGRQRRLDPAALYRRGENMPQTNRSPRDIAADIAAIANMGVPAEVINQRILNRHTSNRNPAENPVSGAMRTEREKARNNVRGNPVYSKCPSCEYTTMIEIEPELTTNFTCPKCSTSFQISGAWKPKEIMFLEISDPNVVPYLCKTKPVPHTAMYFAIWNLIAKIWPDVKNFVEYGHFKYYTPSQFSAIITNDPEITAYDADPVKANSALMTKIRSFENQSDIINPQPQNVEEFVNEFLIEVGEFEQHGHKSKPRPQRNSGDINPIDDLDVGENPI